ncbi:MAG: SRPBCC domain-containing protein [Candidatus Andeanibacterium colombiense]|uniref:SRPBCC domain-containing protein n=1 Tax=Candidatus Andeanibacterium colombiense TaxID=3121345 RepID=A0AAJ6BNS4_9SPHN|nr:MAG: SRPBCC domain-containing protein [Sphingomonadaceae bacterium]
MAENHELTVTEYIEAAPDKVWDILANRQAEWWCPTPWRVEIDHQDRKAGGRCAMTMYGPNGEVMPNEGVYLEYTEGKRYVVTDAFSLADGEYTPTGPFMLGIWEIAPERSGTRFTGRARHWTAEAKEGHEKMGFLEGWGLVAKQLKALCEGEA